MHLTCQFGDRSIDRGKWRWWEVQVASDDIIAKDHEKYRVKRLKVVREVRRSELFGESFEWRIAEVRAELTTWKDILWLKPAKHITESDIAPLLAQWHDAIIPWWKRQGSTTPLPRVVRIIRSRAAVADVAAVAAVAAAAADADADAAAAAFYRLWPYWARWYARPRYALWQSARWKIAGLTEPNPWTPLIEMFKLGCAPIGYVTLDGVTAFTVYAPEYTPSNKVI